MQTIQVLLIAAGVIVLVVLLFVFKSFIHIGPDEQGLVTKNMFGKPLPDGRFVAMDGEAGYQLETLRPGWRFKLWPVFSVQRVPLVQIPAGSIGIVIAQVGAPLPPGARLAAYKPSFGNYEDVRAFLDGGGQMGIQRMQLAQGTTARIHPVAFIVMTTNASYGVAMSQVTENTMHQVAQQPLTMIANRPEGENDKVLVVTALEGSSDPEGDMASRIGGFEDIKQMEADGRPAAEIIEAILSSKNGLHHDYQDFQTFLDRGGHGGLQHDVLRYGSFALNPFAWSVEVQPMLVVRQGQVAVIKSYVGLPTVDTSGTEFKHGSIVAPGHRGIWSEPLRTGKYALNPRAYAFEIVPTSILTLNWGDNTSNAHNLDARLNSIHAKSVDGFDFSIDLQVQIHVPDVQAPKVISMVGTMDNLVNEVLQSAVGNYFRNALQNLTAMEFIQKRSEVQAKAETYVKEYLTNYNVEVRGVYIQDVEFPEELVRVLTEREIAAQEKETYGRQQEAEVARIELEKARGTSAAQAELARATVSVDIETANASASVARAEGQAKVTERLGEAEARRITAVGVADASAIEARGLAQAKGFEAQKDAIGSDQTALVAGLEAIGKNGVKITPDIMVGGGGSILDALGATFLSGRLNGHGSNGDRSETPVKAPALDTETRTNGEHPAAAASS